MNWKLNYADWVAVAKGAGLAAAGAAIGYLISVLPNLGLGEYAAFVGALLSVLLNYVRKAAAPEKPPDPPAGPAAPALPPPEKPLAPWMAPLAAGSLLLLLCGPAAADIRIRGLASVPAGRMARLEVTGDTAGAGIAWDITDEAKLDLEESGTRMILTGPPGVYLVKARATRVKDGVTTVDTARFTLTLEGARPPGPGPTPPGPTPPAGPLTLALSAAYLAEPDPGKAGQLQDLIALYEKAPVNDEGVKNYKQLSDEVRAAAAAMGLTGKLPGVQRVAAGELARAFPADLQQPLDRALAGATFARIAASLKEVASGR